MSSGFLIPDPNNTPDNQGSSSEHAQQSAERCMNCLAMNCCTDILGIDAPGTRIHDSGVFGIIEGVTAGHVNPIFTDILRVCFTLHFKLLRAPVLHKPESPKVPFHVVPRSGLKDPRHQSRPWGFQPYKPGFNAAASRRSERDVSDTVLQLGL
ncbi:hypothetical protein DFH09DRAFT_1108338 [Mycena vulgaris]|nr:hypothetical protein DFH09DRAFT_1108338 [Mycena vulgaris]